MNKGARLFKALGDETRLRIVALLTRGELCVCDLMAVLALPQSTVSRHLSYLKNAGWVRERRQGVWMYYRLAEPIGGLHQAVLGALQQELVRVPEAVADAQKLTYYLSVKNREAC